MTHCFRLRRGQDLFAEVEYYAKAHHIAAGVILSGVGCLTRWEVRDASGVRVRSGEEPVEIVSLTARWRRPDAISISVSAGRTCRCWADTCAPAAW